MKNIRSMLNEKVYLLTLNNNNSNCLTYKKYKACYESKAYITHISCNEMIPEYEIIIPKPPPIFNYTSFAGVEWNNDYYKFKTVWQLYYEQFIKSSIVPIY